MIFVSATTALSTSYLPESSKVENDYYIISKSRALLGRTCFGEP